MAGISVLLFTGIITTLIIVMAIIAIYMLVSYVFESIAIMKFIKNLGYKNNAIAFIPFYNKYLLGKICNNKTLGIVLSIVSALRLITFILWFFIEINFMFELFVIFLISGFILNCILASNTYKLYSKYNVIFTILTIVTLGILRPVFIFALKDNKIIK